MIQLLPLGPVARDQLVAAAATIKGRFGCACELLPAAGPPAHAWNRTRGQYDADTILEYLFDRLPVDVMRIVGITEVDLFAEGRNFVFGYAHMRDRVAVFSLLRLREGWWGRADNPELLCSRIDRALTHEVGHTFHAPHCERPRCVMHQVEYLWQLDELLPAYCAACEARVRQVAARGVDGPEALFELAGSYMRRRRYARAAASYAAAITRDPHNAHFHNDHGVSLLALGERAAAAEAFQRAVELAPRFPHAYYNLGIVSRERGDARAADRFFEQALERDHDPRAAYRYLGALHQDYFNDAQRARVYFERYRALGGSDAEVLRRLRTLSEPLHPVRPVVTESSAPVVTESSAPV